MARATRGLLTGLLALLLAAVAVQGAAYAEPGPFFHHRLNEKEGAGTKIEEKSPEKFNGEGGEQKLKAHISTEPIEIVTKSQQVKGFIYNTALQGQAKVLMIFKEPKLVKPSLPECEVKIGESNTVKFRVYLTWKWNGLKEQLSVSPQRKVQGFDGIVIDKEIAAGATELPKGQFTTVTLSKCSILNGKFAVNGSATAPKLVPATLEEWKKELKLAYAEGRLKQHFWNSKEFIGGETGLIFAGNEADLSGEGSLHAEQQEVAVFEK